MAVDITGSFSFLQENPSPSEQQIEDNFDGNICRCTGNMMLCLNGISFASCNNPSVEQSNNDCSAIVRLQTNPGCNENICKNLRSIGY